MIALTQTPGSAGGLPELVNSRIMLFAPLKLDPAPKGGAHGTCRFKSKPFELRGVNAFESSPDKTLKFIS